MVDFRLFHDYTSSINVFFMNFLGWISIRCAKAQPPCIHLIHRQTFNLAPNKKQSADNIRRQLSTSDQSVIPTRCWWPKPNPAPLHGLYSPPHVSKMFERHQLSVRELRRHFSLLSYIRLSCIAITSSSDQQPPQKRRALFKFKISRCAHGGTSPR